MRDPHPFLRHRQSDRQEENKKCPAHFDFSPWLFFSTKHAGRNLTVRLARQQRSQPCDSNIFGETHGVSTAMLAFQHSPSSWSNDTGMLRARAEEDERLAAALLLQHPASSSTQLRSTSPPSSGHSLRSPASSSSPTDGERGRMPERGSRNRSSTSQYSIGGSRLSPTREGSHEEADDDDDHDHARGDRDSFDGERDDEQRQGDTGRGGGKKRDEEDEESTVTLRLAPASESTPLLFGSIAPPPSTPSNEPPYDPYSRAAAKGELSVLLKCNIAFAFSPLSCEYDPT